MIVPRFLGAVALSLAVAAVILSGQGRAAESGNGLLVGQVVDARSGRPVAGAIVSIGGVPRPPILTGSTGRFVFRDLPRGSYTVTATKQGYADGAYGRRRPGGPAYAVTTGPDERVGDLSIAVWKHAALGGTVLDESGERLVRVQVRAWRRTIVAGFPRLAPAGTTLTDDRGTFRIAGLLPGEYVVAASARHSVVPSSVDTTEWGASALRFRDLVYLLGRGTATPPPPVERLFIYPATYYAGAPNAANADLVTVRPGDEWLSVDLQVHPVPAARVAGRLLSPAGPAAFQTVRLVPEGTHSTAADPDAPTVASDAGGGFVFPAVPPGRYTLRSSMTLVSSIVPESQPVWAAVPLQVGATDIDGLTVSLVPELRIRGHVEFEGTTQRPAQSQVARIPILVESADGDGELGPVPFARPSPDGEFTSPGLVGGRYVLRVTDSPPGWMFASATYGGRDISTSALDLTGSDATGVIISFTDRWSGLTGSVQGRSRNPDPDALVVMFPADRQLWTGYGSSSRLVRGARTGTYGEYALRSVPPGDYYLAAIPDERGDGWEAPSNLELLARDATRVTLRRGETRRLDLRTREAR